MAKIVKPLDSSWLVGLNADVDGDKVTRLVLHKDTGKAMIYEAKGNDAIPTTVLDALQNADSPGTYYREHVMDAYEHLYVGTEELVFKVA